MDILIRTILIFVLIFLNAIFAGSETALIAASEHRVLSDAKKGNKKANKVLGFIKDTSNFLSTIQVGITFIGFVNGFLAAEAFTGPLLNQITKIFENANSTVLRPIIQIVITIILTYLQVVFGELVPKKLAMKNPEKFIYLNVSILSLVRKAMKPLVWLLTSSADAFGSLFGANDEKEQMSEEEIRMILVTNQSAIAPREREMIENVLDFDDQLTNDVMTHRTELSALNVDSNLDEVIDFLAEVNYSRIPVYDEDIDDIVGIFHAKDLLPFIKNNGEKFKLRNIMRKAYFVPDSKRTSELFIEMQKRKNYMSIVIDEFGGTAGVITIEDLLEEIVGNIFDEYDDIEVEVETIDDNTYKINGLSSIDDVDAIIEADLPIDDFDTLSGFILGELGRFPRPNEKVIIDYKNFKFEILKYKGKVIELVKATRIVPKIEEEDEDE